MLFVKTSRALHVAGQLALSSPQTNMKLAAGWCIDLSRWHTKMDVIPDASSIS
jgi:hypothetical protein